MKKITLLTSLLFVGFMVTGCGGSSDPKIIDRSNQDNTQTLTVDGTTLPSEEITQMMTEKDVLKVVQGVYQEDNTVIDIDDSGYVNVYTYDLFNRCLNDVQEGDISYLLDGKTLHYNNDKYLFSIFDDNGNEYEIHYNERGITGFSLGGITGASLNINGTMLTNRKSTQFSEENISANMCSVVVSEQSLANRTLISSSITNTNTKVAKIKSFEVIGSAPVENERAVVSNGFKIVLNLERNLNSNEIINLVLSKNSASTVKRADYVLMLSNTLAKVEILCTKKDSAFECSSNNKSVLLQNDIYGDGYLDLFICEGQDIVRQTCNYADILIRI